MTNNGSEAIGREGYITVERGLIVRVKILNARVNYGRVDYLITPASGEGQEWVSAKRIILAVSAEVKS